ncbi:hypothetical protein Bca52824_004572 [Brassica carinata]|uniref:Zinc finger PHD-type domain-containing protein n=1 Tax=Brassica carinata TaxID=52824 RepID=A0A8X7WPZ7_BRACI|nr:hypothetical protein Bca52824_004572 [Brassica carinata]
MSSVGVFLEKEINGKPFHIFSLLPETDNSSSSSYPSLSGEEAIDSGGGDNDPSLQTRFICPNSRYQLERLRNMYISVDSSVPVGTSPHFNKEDVDQLDGAGRNRRTICKHPVLPLFWCNNETPKIECGACEILEVGSGYYLCETCNKVYHKECVEAPEFIKHHPSVPSFSSHLYSNLGGSHHISCFICETEIMIKQMGYFSPTHNVRSHTVCLLKPVPITVDHFKRHPHPLTLFPKQASLACDICGMIKRLIPTYICARCVFVVHRDCIYFPYVIRISRHHHRISFTYSPLPSGKLTCGVCRQKVDNSCGAYSCNKCDGYFVHSRCALRKDVWDGEELEGTPEEIEIVEDPFKTIADGIILHFSHEHHLKLEICRAYDEDKYCQACVLPIYEGNYYSCVNDLCDFILHETCANAPRKIRHPLHAHSLTLKVVTNEYDHNKGFFRCNACLRPCNGFVYEESTATRRFRLDLRCASISEPFKYEGHDHPLFLALSPHEEVGAKCYMLWVCYFSIQGKV